MTTPQETRAGYDELRAILGVDTSIDVDDPLWLRLAEIDIELTAAEVTLARSNEDPLRQTATLKLTELDRRLAELAGDILGYYALAFEPPGSNEAPIGGETARRLRSRFLARTLDDEAEAMAIRDRLAAWLGSKPW